MCPPERDVQPVRRRRETLALVALLVLAAAVRFYRVDVTWFSLDQVRDVTTASEIARGAGFPLLGPRIGWTDAYLGPVYFYLLALPFAIARDPVAAVIFVALGQLVALVLLYRFAREFFGPAVALYAVALFAVFPLTVFSSRLVWHAGLVPPLVILYMHALYRLVLKERPAEVVWLCGLLAVLTQLHLAAITLGAVALAAVLIFRPRIRTAHVALGMILFLVLYAPYLAHEIGHGFHDVRALAGVASPEPGGGHLRSLGRAVANLLTLFARALDAFIVEDEWSSRFLALYRVVHRAEAVLFTAGLAVCAARLLRVPRHREPDAVRIRGALALLLLWLGVPILTLGSRLTPIWWYYLDPIHPAPFIVAGIALTVLPRLASRAVPWSKALASAPVCLAAVIVAFQAMFLLGFQRRSAERGELIVRVPMLSINGTTSYIDTLTMLPLGERRDIVSSLVRDFDVPADAFARSVHGAALGLPEENRYLIESLSRGRTGPRDARRAGGSGDDRPAVPSQARPQPSQPRSDDAHYLVARSDAANPGLDADRSRRIGPYAIYEYRPAIDHATWRCAVRRGADDLGDWRTMSLITASRVLEVPAGDALVCRGTITSRPGGRPGILAVHVWAWAPFEATRLEMNGRALAPAGSVSRQQPLMLRARDGWSMGLGWTSETVFTLGGSLGPGANRVQVELAGTGRVIMLDAYEGRSW